MTETPIYDELVQDKKNQDAVDGFRQRVLASRLSLRGEVLLMKRYKDEDFIYEYQVNELKTRRRHDYEYHRDFKRKYGRKVYKSVVDWKV